MASPNLPANTLARRTTFDWAKRAILEMFRQTGPCQFDEAGLLTRGVVIRHLILRDRRPRPRR